MDGAVARLVAALEALMDPARPEDTLVVSVPDRSNRYLQFTGHAGTGVLYGEAASNEFLAEKHALSPEQIQHLQANGWSAPTEAQSPNFYREWTITGPEDMGLISRGAVRALAAIYHVHDLESLEFELFAS